MDGAVSTQDGAGRVIPLNMIAAKISSPETDVFDPYAIITFPLSTEKTIRQIEFDNRLVFVISEAATKADVKKAVEQLFKVKVRKVTVHHTFKCQKRAYVTLSKEYVASDVSADLGLI